MELLGKTFREHNDISGIKICGKEHRISQFADDTTLFMKYCENNLRVCMSVLHDFYLISGLKINVEKTKAIKFGTLRDSGMNLCDDLELIWTRKFTSLGIEYDIDKLQLITDLNIKPKLIEMEKLVSIWKNRNLTLIGKITIIKTLLISKIIHILLSLPSPSEELFKNIEEVFTKFLWNDKPPKFKLFTLEQQTANGGLQFPDIRKIDKTMKASWIKRMYKSDEGWASVPVFYGLNRIYEYGEVFLQKKLEIRNVFWKDVIMSVVEVYNNSSIKSIEHLLSMPIWYNTKVIQERIPKWTEKGICT